MKHYTHLHLILKICKFALHNSHYSTAAIKYANTVKRYLLAKTMTFN